MKVDTFFIRELEIKLLSIYHTNLPLPDRYGKIGEKFVKEGIKYYFWKKGFCVNKTGNETFNIGGPYKPVTGGMGGIDFRLEFRYNNISYDCYVEVKNWMHLKKGIPPAMFNTQILTRFTKNASQSGSISIVIMNKRNVHFIRQNCKQNNIKIVPLEEHITSIFLNFSDLNRIMELFLDSISKLMNKITRSKIKNSTRKAGMSITDQIKEDIRLGKPYSLIMATYNKSKTYIQKIKSKMAGQGVVLVKRNTKEWAGMQFKTMEQVNKSYNRIRKSLKKKRMDKDGK